MPPEYLVYIAKYGYWALFALVFMQEIGIPSPLPNELILTFAGYLSYKGILFFPFVFGLVCLADWIGTTLLFFLFYFFSTWVVAVKTYFFPKPYGLLVNLNRHVSGSKQIKLFALRLAPFIRGYTSIAAGMLRIQPTVFIKVVGLSALTWAIFYLGIGYLFGPYWEILEQNIGHIKVAATAGSIIVVSFFGLKLIINSLLKRQGHN